MSRDKVLLKILSRFNLYSEDLEPYVIDVLIDEILDIGEIVYKPINTYLIENYLLIYLKMTPRFHVLSPKHLTSILNILIENFIVGFLDKNLSLDLKNMIPGLADEILDTIGYPNNNNFVDKDDFIKLLLNLADDKIFKKLILDTISIPNRKLLLAIPTRWITDKQLEILLGVERSLN